MPTFSVIVLLAGRLIASGFACGLNLYATIALIGLVSRFGWIDLPPGLLGLDQWLLIAGAASLFVAEFIASAIPVVDTIWEAVHTVVRPLGAGALTFVALEGAPWPLRLLGSLTAAIAAFAAHSAKVGLRFVVTQKRALRLAISAAEDLAAAILAVGALILPAVSLGMVGLFLSLLVIIGPGLWRASAFSVRATIALLSGFFGERGWTEGDGLPPALRRRLDPPELGQPEPRAVRATLSSRTTGSWRYGWVVLDGRKATFLFRRRLRLQAARLPRPDEPAIRHGLLADVVTWTAGDDHWSLHLHKDGPPAEITVGALQLAIQ